MKKIIIGATLATIVAGLAYYPTYRAPKAHAFIEGEIAQLNTFLQSKEIGSVTIANHSTDRSSSSLELEWLFSIPSDIQNDLNIPDITAKSALDIHLGFFPSSKGFSSAESVTNSKEINAFLAKQGHQDGFNLTCDTTPTSNGETTDCTTNALNLTNTSAENKAQEIQKISLAESTFQVIHNRSDHSVETSSNLPSFEVHGKEVVLGLAKNISAAASMPYDPTGEVAFVDTLTGNQVLNGAATSSFSIERIEINAPQAPSPIIMMDLQAEGNSVTEDLLTRGEGFFKINQIEGTPVDVQALNYGFTIANIDTVAMNEVSRLFETLGTAAPNTQPIDPDAFKKHIITFLSKGPELELNLTVDQSTGDQLKIDTSTVFKEGTPEDITAALTPLLDAPSGDKMALLNFALDNLDLKVDAVADEATARNIAILATSSGERGAQATPDQQQQAAAQGIGMLEMLGILKKEESKYVAHLEMNDKGILLNGTDMAPMLGLPPRSTQ